MEWYTSVLTQSIVWASGQIELNVAEDQVINEDIYSYGSNLYAFLFE